MPIYEYRCENGHTFEVMQKMTDDPVSVCTTCEAPVQRVFHPVAVHFKGKGFYNTDYGTKRRNRELERSGKDGADKLGLVVVLLGQLELRLGLGARATRSRRPRTPAPEDQGLGLLVAASRREEGLAGR